MTILLSRQKSRISTETPWYHPVKLLGTIHSQVNMKLSLNLAGKSDNFFQESKRSRLRASCIDRLRYDCSKKLYGYTQLVQTVAQISRVEVTERVMAAERVSLSVRHASV
jgi:hypothetical protein